MEQHDATASPSGGLYARHGDFIAVFDNFYYFFKTVIHTVSPPLRAVRSLSAPISLDIFMLYSTESSSLKSVRVTLKFILSASKCLIWPGSAFKTFHNVVLFIIVSGERLYILYNILSPASYRLLKQMSLRLFWGLSALLLLYWQSSFVISSFTLVILLFLFI